MKTMMIIYTDDDEESHRIIDEMIDRVVRNGGSYWSVQDFSEKRNKYYTEHHFLTATMKDLLDDRHHSEQCAINTNVFE